MQLDICAVPFSRAGSYMSFNIMPPHWNQPGVLLRTHRALGGAFREVLRLTLTVGGRAAIPTVTASPTHLLLAHDAGRVEICFAAPDVVRIRGAGVGLELSSILGHRVLLMPLTDGQWQVNPWQAPSQYLLTRLAGAVQARFATDRGPGSVSKPKQGAPAGKPQVTIDVGADGQPFEIAIEELLSTPRRIGLTGTFAECAADSERDWLAWRQRTPSLPRKYAPAAEKAMYVNWASIVAASGLNRTDTMVMSKNWMNCCWTWDHCFNAIALSYAQPDLAWEQLCVPFHHQDRFGCLPDCVHVHALGWSAVKPPIHGWALTKMLANPALRDPKRLRWLYPRLARWTQWWLRHRDSDGDGLPEYLNGCDSGWDNATVFDLGSPTLTPDLSAFLILQMDALSDVAQILGKPDDVRRWKDRADALLRRMLERLWNGRQFISIHLPTGQTVDAGDCLLNQLPVLLGKRLPKRVMSALADDLAPDGKYVTAFGPATESPASPLYEPDGYWRGPIWAPVVVMLVDGLHRGGRTMQARELARRFCDMAAASEFAENYDALTGQPLRDKAYTWASSAYLILAHEQLAAVRKRKQGSRPRKRIRKS